jgi:hypothetical protein
MDITVDRRPSGNAETPFMKRRSPALNREAFAAEIAGVSKLGTDDLRERWKAICGKALPQKSAAPF